MTQTQDWTIGRLLDWTRDFLQERGVENARLDAEILLAEARGCERIDLYAAYSEPASEETRTAFRELVRRRSEGTPVAYLVGRREFYSLSFHVTPDVLIPRPETELLVIALLDRIRETQHTETVEIADVGTGSGIIAVCAARQCKSARVRAIDLSPAALKIAAHNIQAHEVTAQVELIESDLLTAVPTEVQFDYIVSNPPYVSTSEFAQLAADVREFEPRLALEAGEQGTEVIERLLPQAAERLKPGGWLLMEISPMIQEAVESLVSADDHFSLSETIKDLAGLPRVIQAQRKAD